MKHVFTVNFIQFQTPLKQYNFDKEKSVCSCTAMEKNRIIFFSFYCFLSTSGVIVALCTWRGCFFFCIDTPLQDMLGPDQGYDGMYGQGPPSVHSSHGGRPYQQQGRFRCRQISNKPHAILSQNNFK